MAEEMNVGRDDLDKQASRNTGPCSILGPPWAPKALRPGEEGGETGPLHHHTPVRWQRQGSCPQGTQMKEHDIREPPV